MYSVEAQYAAVPESALLIEDYSACYAVPAFLREGVRYIGLEAQPGFSPAQSAELGALGLIFDSAEALLQWQTS